MGWPPGRRRYISFRPMSESSDCLNDSKNNQAEPEIHHHAQINLEWHVMSTSRQIFFQQKVRRISYEHRHESV